MNPPSDTPPSADPVAPGDGGDPPASHSAPRPVAKAPRINRPAAPARQDAPDQGTNRLPEMTLADILGWANKLRSAAKSDTVPNEPAPEARQAQIDRTNRKFRRFDPEAAKAEQLPAGVSQAAEPGDSDESAPGGTPHPGAAPLTGREFRSDRRRSKGKPYGLLSIIIAQFAVLLLMAASFLVGRSSVVGNTHPPAGRPQPILAEGEKAAANPAAQAAGIIDQAMVAETAGDYNRAAALLNQLKADGAQIAGLDYQLALLAFRSGDYSGAMPLLNHSIAANDFAGSCYGIRGLIESRRTGSMSGLRDFEAATKADPFEAANYFYWGEALRRMGKAQEAITRLKQAIDRATTIGDLNTYRFKVRLTQIELGQEQEFAKELEREMEKPRPSIEWVLTAAAKDMHDGNYQAAAAYLDRARQLVDPSVVSGALRDYFFIGYADQAPLAPYFATAVSPRPAPETAPQDNKFLTENPFSLKPAASPGAALDH